MAFPTLKGKLGIVTGASRGIGTAIAQNLASKGCNLVLAYTSASSQERIESLSQELQSRHSVRTLVVRADQGAREGARDLVSAAKAHFADPATGALRIDIIVNNAGVAYNDLLPDVKPADFDVSYRVNVLGPLLLVQACEPHLPRDRTGRVVNLSSVSSSTGFLGQSVYGGTKAALEAMTRTWSRELAERCTVNAVNPGPVLTEMYAGNTPMFKAHIKGFIEHTPLMRPREGVDSAELVEDARESGGRPAYVEEIAGIVGMLCSDESAWCTGQVVCANGGMVMLH